jgi:calmodulin
MSDSAAPGMSRHSADLGELRKEFILADLDGDGRIDYREFQRLLQGLDADMSESEMKIGFDEVDTNRDGLIDCQEFVDWWSGD